MAYANNYVVHRNRNTNSKNPYSEHDTKTISFNIDRVEIMERMKKSTPEDNQNKIWGFKKAKNFDILNNEILYYEKENFIGTSHTTNPCYLTSLHGLNVANYTTSLEFEDKIKMFGISRSREHITEIDREREKLNIENTFDLHESISGVYYGTVNMINTSHSGLPTTVNDWTRDGPAQVDTIKAGAQDLEAGDIVESCAPFWNMNQALDPKNEDDYWKYYQYTLPHSLRNSKRLTLRYRKETPHIDETSINAAITLATTALGGGADIDSGDVEEVLNGLRAYKKCFITKRVRMLCLKGGSFGSEVLFSVLLD